MSVRAEVARARPRHQLLIHIDYGEPLGNALEIRYSYPFVRPPHQLGERLIRIPSDDIAPAVKEDLGLLMAALRRRIPEPQAVRLPHATVRPTIDPGILTVVLQDSTRDLPVVRLYWYERVEPLGTRAEFESRMDGRNDCGPDELAAWHRLRRAIRAIAWSDYTRLMGSVAGTNDARTGGRGSDVD